MFIESGFGRNLDIMHRLMDTAVLRHNVIANNMANAETPNFKRSEVNFEKELKRRLDLEREGKYTLDFDKNKECKFAFRDPEPYSTLKPIRSLDYLSQADNNGNNVNLEEEGMSALNNQLRYEMMTHSVAAMFNNIRTALTSR